MRMTRPLLALLLIAALSVTAQAAGQAQGQKGAGPVTVGDFAVMLAATTGKGGPALEVKSATDALVKAGVPLGNPKATLSEAKLVEILGFYGVNVKSSTPDSTVTRSKAQAALQLVGGSLASGMSTASTAGPSPATLDDCLAEVNHGQCTNCCKALGGEANTCSKFCFQIRVSEGEPQP